MLFEEEYENKKSGIKALIKVFVENRGFNQEQVVSLLFRYPPILAKNEEELNDFFKIMNK